jgi:hypothetical protein
MIQDIDKYLINMVTQLHSGMNSRVAYMRAWSLSASKAIDYKGKGKGKGKGKRNSKEEEEEEEDYTGFKQQTNDSLVRVVFDHEFDALECLSVRSRCDNDRYSSSLHSSKRINSRGKDGDWGRKETGLRDSADAWMDLLRSVLYDHWSNIVQEVSKSTQ